MQPLRMLMVLWCVMASPAWAERADQETLLVLSDGAMVASGYIDGRLGKTLPDLLRIMRVADGQAIDMATVPVSNSVAIWPNIMTLTPDQRHVLVTEPYAQPPTDAKTFADIPRGNTITVIDIQDTANPQVVHTLAAPAAPAAIDVHPNGDLVAVTFPFAGKIGLYSFKDGQLEAHHEQDLGIDNLSSTFVPEFSWHPSGMFAAVTLGGANKVVFYRYDGTRLIPWGSPLDTPPLPGKGVWTQNGRYYITTNINAVGDMASSSYRHSTSVFAVYAFDATEAHDSLSRRRDERKGQQTGPAVAHTRVALVPAGMGYVENFALSPDERWLVGLNMAASWLPEGHAGRTEFSELTLFSFERETGLLEPVSVTRLDGVILPQGIAFDASGQRLAITVFQDATSESGGVEFWDLKTEGTPRFEQAGERRVLPRGSHYLEYLRE